MDKEKLKHMIWLLSKKLEKPACAFIHEKDIAVLFEIRDLLENLYKQLEAGDIVLIAD